MAQQVGPLAGRVQCGSGQCAAHDVADGRGGAEPAAWRVQMNEDPPRGASERPTVAQVVGHGLADVAGQWQGLALIALAGHADDASGPVEIVQRERADFAAAQPEPGQQEQDGVVTPPGHCPAITASQDRFDGFQRDRFRRARLPPVDD